MGNLYKPISAITRKIGTMRQQCALATTLFFTLLLPMAAHAGNQEKPDRVLVVEMKDGNRHLYSLHDHVEISFAAGTMTVDSESLTSAYDISLIDNYHFEINTEVKIDANVADCTSLSIESIAPNVYRISGPEISCAEIYGVSGYLVERCPSVNNQVTVDLQRHPSGVYVALIMAGNNSQSVKLIKK